MAGSEYVFGRKHLQLNAHEKKKASAVIEKSGGKDAKEAGTDDSKSASGDLNDAVFGAQLLDNLELSDVRFKHCTFVNISFKDANVLRCTFLNCVFVACYFHRASVENCIFTACRFIDSDLHKIKFFACTLNYIQFRGCYLRFKEIATQLPKEQNNVMLMCRNLAAEAAAAGDNYEASQYRKQEIAAHELDLWRTVIGYDQHYKDHHDSFERIAALWQVAISKLNGILFGYAESVSILVRNFLIASLALFPVWYYALREQFTPIASGSSPSTLPPTSAPIGFWDCFTYSLDRVVPGGSLSTIKPTTASMAAIVAATESIFAVVLAGLIVTYTFRWSSRK